MRVAGDRAAGSATRKSPTGGIVRAASGAWPLVGRREKLAFVAEALHRGQPSGVVIAGAAGVGKTRLAAEALREAEARGLATAWATATRAASSIPFGALAHLLPPIEARSAQPFEVLRRVGDALVERADSARLALALDDAHLLDGASATLVHQLAAGERATIVLTVRAEESAPDPVVALWKDGLADYLELQALSRDDVAQLLEEALGEVEGRTANRLWEATRGNALFLRELVRSGMEQGSLVLADGLWRWEGSLATGSRLAQLIDDRVGHLEPAERELLELVGVAEPIDAELVELLTAPGTLDELHQRRLVEIAPEGRRLNARLAHPLYGDTLRRRLSPLRRRAIMRRLAGALERSGPQRPDDVLRLATWRLDSGGEASAALLLSAARRAETLFDPGLAERLARAAADRGAGFAAELLLARALQEQGRSAEVERLLDHLGARARGDAERVELAELRSGNLFWGLGRLAEAEEVLRQSERAIADRARRDELLSLRVGFACAAGRPNAALEAAAPILEGKGASRRALLRTLLHAVPGLAIVGRTEDALAAAERGIEAASALDEELPFAPGQLVIGRLLALRLAGKLGEADQVGTDAYKHAFERGDRDSMALIAMFLGQIALEQGRVRAAVRRLREGRALLLEVDVMGFLPWCEADLARALALAGDATAARATLDDAKLTWSESIGITRAPLGTAGVWVAVSEDETSAALRLTQSVGEEAETLGQAVFAAIAFHDMVRLGRPRQALPRLEAIAATSDGQLCAVFAQHASALAAGSGERLEAVERGFEEIGSILLAAESATDAAAAYRSAGRPASSRSALARARLLVARCEGARTPALAALPETDRLTAREREVATLAARGLSSRAIAERLVISARTVENHLHHAYRKLGVAGRAELASLLEPDRSE
jgi:DNA-binding CsgD family transcriptional regulator